MKKLECGVSTGKEVIEKINASGEPIVATGKLIGKLELGTEDCTVLINGDSTGNSSIEWVYRLAEWYAIQYPAYTVDYYSWNADTNDWYPVIEMQEGTGTKKLTVWNASISGSKPDFIAGAFWQKAVLEVTKADLVILNHGHNMMNSFSAETTESQRTPQFLEATMSLLKAHAGAGMLLVAQNPRRDDDGMEVVRRATHDAASIGGYDVADVYSKFIDLGKSTDLYIDNVHPSVAGTNLFLQAVQEQHLSGRHRPAVSSLESAGNNILLNGNFAAFSGAIPDNWTGVQATASKNTTQYENPTGYSVTLVTSTAGQACRIQQDMTSKTLSRLRGGWVTLAVRVYRPSGQPNTAGRIGLISTSGSSNNSTQSSGGIDGWKWVTLTHKVAVTDTYLRVIMYADSGTAGGTAHFDRAILVEGRLPKDII